jgi:chorismate dehydratase
MGEEKLRLGRVSYKNTLPLFYDWKLPFVEVREGTPSQIANLLELGMLDGGIVSSLFFVQKGARYTLLPDLSISSFGRSSSVLLFSKKPLERIESVKISPESITSNFLTYAVLRKFEGLPAEFKKEGETDAELVIGDAALRRAGERRDPFVYDVGELWYRHTSLPSVFAVFVVPTGWFLKNPDRAAELTLTLWRSKERFFKEADGVVDRETLRYLKNLNYDFREEHLESLNLLEKLYREYLLERF